MTDEELQRSADKQVDRRGFTSRGAMLIVTLAVWGILSLIALGVYWMGK